MAVKNLLIRGGADFSGIQKEMSKTQRTLSNFQNNVSGIMGKVGAVLGGLALGKLVKDSTEMAMGVESSINQINRTMGSSAGSFGKWVNEQAGAFGIAKAEALKYGSVYSNLVSGFSKNTAETAKYTEDLLKASAVVASGTGRTMEDTMERIRSGLLGNTESIEDLGLNVNVAMLESTKAFQQFANGKSWQQLDFQTQQQIRLMAILEQANSKYGDSLANTTATQMMMFRAELKNVQLALGQAFLPILNVVLPLLTALASRLATVFGFVAQFTRALFGFTGAQKQQSSAADQMAKANLGAGAAFEKAGGKAGKAGKKAKKAADEAKGALASFDEINSLSQGSGSAADDSDAIGDGVGDAGGVGAVDVPGLNAGKLTDGFGEVSAKAQEMADNVKKAFGDMASFISSNKEVILSVIGGIIGGFLAFKTLTFLSEVPIMISGIGGALSALLSPIAIASIAIGALIATFLYLYQTNDQFRNDINAIWTDIGNSFNDFFNNTLKPIGDYMLNGFIMPIVNAFKTYLLPVFAELFVGASQILGDLFNLVFSTITNLWGILQPALELLKTIIIDTLQIIKDLWDKYGQELIDNIRAFIKGVQETFQLIWDNIINPIIKPALEMLTWLWNSHLKGLVEEIGAFILKCINGALEIYNGFIKPIIDWMVKVFGPMFAWAINIAVNVLGTFLAGAIDVAKGLFRSLGGIIDFITGIFTGNWKKALQGVKDIFGGIFDSFIGIAKTPLNFIIDLINGVLAGINGVGKYINKIPGVNIGEIPKIPKLARGGIVDSPTLAMIGEAGKEAVVPLENTGFVDKLAGSLGTAVMAAMQMGNCNSSEKNGDIYLQIDGTTFARIINPYGAAENQRIGNNVIIQTT